MRILRALRFAVGFGIARTLLLAAPIVLANVLPLKFYGQLELAQSYAAVAALLLGAGLPATVPLIRLRPEVDGRWDTLLLILSIIGGGCLVAALVAAAGLGGFDPLPVLILLATGVLILQGLWATSLKTDGKSTKAVFLEAGFWSVAAVAGAVMGLSQGVLSTETVSVAVLVYGMFLLGFTVKSFIAERGMLVSLGDLRKNIALGLPLMFTSILTVVLISSGRMLLGQVFGVEIVGVYSVLYRCTILALVAHQILTIGLFRNIFAWPVGVLRARVPVIVYGVTAMVWGFWLIEPHLGWVFGDRFIAAFSIYRAEGLFLLVQTILWSAIALNDLLNSRLQIAGKVACFTSPFLVLGLVALGWWSHVTAGELMGNDVLLYFIRAHFTFMSGYFVTQCVAAYLQGQIFGRLWSATAICVPATGLIIFVGENI